MRLLLAAADLLEQAWEHLNNEVKKSAIVKTDNTYIKIQDLTGKGSMRKMTP